METVVIGLLLLALLLIIFVLCTVLYILTTVIRDNALKLTYLATHILTEAPLATNLEDIEKDLEELRRGPDRSVTIDPFKVDTDV